MWFGSFCAPSQIEENSKLCLTDSLEVLPHNVLSKHLASCSLSDGMTLESCKVHERHMVMFYRISAGLNAGITSLITTCTEMVCWGGEGGWVHLPFTLEGSSAESFLPCSASLLPATGFGIMAKLS